MSDFLLDFARIQTLLGQTTKVLNSEVSSFLWLLSTRLYIPRIYVQTCCDILISKVSWYELLVVWSCTFFAPAHTSSVALHYISISRILGCFFMVESIFLHGRNHIIYLSDIICDFYHLLALILCSLSACNIHIICAPVCVYVVPLDLDQGLHWVGQC